MADETVVYNPWHPMKDTVDIKHLGKLGEETGELSAIISRCLIQGIYEQEPVTGKFNVNALEEEIADVLANIDLVVQRFNLNKGFILIRREEKVKRLTDWHRMA